MRNAVTATALFIGLDLGTSGARAVIIDQHHRIAGEGKASIADFSDNHRACEAWWQAAKTALSTALASVDAKLVRAIAVDGTSGTVLAVDAAGQPLGDGLMYNDPCEDKELLANIMAVAPGDSAALGASSGLARALMLAEGASAMQEDKPKARRLYKIMHQADWISFRLSGRFVSDENNALKTGYDLHSSRWPDWIDAVRPAGLAPFDRRLLPDVLAPGSSIGTITPQAATCFGLPADTIIIAGTTDGCASFLATGANQPGDGVSALGTTLTLKLLSDTPVSAPQFGIYSHRLLGNWLVGGASNTGGNVLLHFFTAEKLAELSQRINPEIASGLDYYPLVKPGERFPISDPAWPPRLQPRPRDDALFLQGLLEGIANIEAMAYELLAKLGAPPLASVRSVGGGAQNPVWSAIRRQRLGVIMPPSASDEAAYGSAILARHHHVEPHRPSMHEDRHD